MCHFIRAVFSILNFVSVEKHSEVTSYFTRRKILLTVWSPVIVVIGTRERILNQDATHQGPILLLVH